MIDVTFDETTDCNKPSVDAVIMGHAGVCLNKALSQGRASATIAILNGGAPQWVVKFPILKP